MPRIPTYTRQAPFEKAVAPQVESGFLTDEYRAMAQAGAAIGGIGDLLQKLQEQDELRKMLEAQAGLATAQSTIGLNYDSPDYLRETFGDGVNSAGVKQLPIAEMATKEMSEYQKVRTDIENKYLGGVSQSAKTRWNYYADMRNAALAEKANVRQYGFAQDALELSFYKSSQAVTNDFINGLTDRDGAQLQLELLADALPETIERERWLTNAINNLDRIAEERQKATAKADRRIFIDQAFSQLVTMSESEARSALGKIQNLESAERGELETRLDNYFTIEKTRKIEAANAYKDQLYDREEKRDDLTYADFDNPVLGDSDERKAKWESYKARKAAAAKGEDVIVNEQVRAALKTLANNVGLGTATRPDALWALDNAFYGQRVNGKLQYMLGDLIGSDKPLIDSDSYRALANEISESLKSSQAHAIGREYGRASKLFSGVLVVSADPSDSSAWAAALMSQMITGGKSTAEANLRFAYIFKFQDMFETFVRDNPDLAAIDWYQVSTEMQTFLQDELEERVKNRQFDITPPLTVGEKEKARLQKESLKKRLEQGQAVLPQSELPRPKTRGEARKLPSGTRFIDTNGAIRIRP